MDASGSAAFLLSALLFLLSQIPALLCESNADESSRVPRKDLSTEGPSVMIVFPENGAIMTEEKWTMRLQFSKFEGLSAIVMFGTGQSLNLSPLDTNFAIVITDFENGPYDVSVIMLDSNRNPVGPPGEAFVTFVVNVSAPVGAGSVSETSASTHVPRRLNDAQRSRSLSLNVLRIALSYSRSVDAKM